MKNYFNKRLSLILSLAIISVISPVNAATKDNSQENTIVVNQEVKLDEEGNVVLELVSDSNNVGFVNNNGVTEFYDISGKQAKSSWINISGKWYRFDENGAMVIGWKKISDKWYYFSENGVKATGWLMYKGDWYYLGIDGIMKVSQWSNIDGNWYYFNEKGIMQKNTIIDGYKINSNGILESNL